MEGGKDPAGAVTLWEKAAEKGHAGSELQLGQAYFTGAGVEETNTKKAMELWESAASKGDTEAVYLLGLCYTGVGIGGENAVEKDLAAVRKLLVCVVQDATRAAPRRQSDATRWRLGVERIPVRRGACARGDVSAMARDGPAAPAGVDGP